MLEPILIGVLLAALIAQDVRHGRRVKAERAHYSEQQDKTFRLLDATHGHIRGLTNQLVLLKVEPKQAAVVALAAETEDVEAPYISAFDDAALAEYERTRAAEAVG